jgi:subtilisin family serine protease
VTDPEHAAARHQPTPDTVAIDVGGSDGDRDDPFAESDDEPTPNGGVGSVIYYQDADGQPVRKSRAVRGEIVEFNAGGGQVGRTVVTFRTEDKAADAE